MVINRKKDSDKTLGTQGTEVVISEANKIGASTPYDFEAKNLRPTTEVEAPILLGSEILLPSPCVPRVLSLSFFLLITIWVTPEN